MRRGWHAVALAALLLTGCGLWPVRRERLVRLDFAGGSGPAYQSEDSAAVYRSEGLVVRVRYLSTAALNAEYAAQSRGRVDLNPFTWGTRINSDLGYVPDRFTVFQVEINNIGLPKLGFDPRQARLVTDRGDHLEPWGAHKGDAQETFEQYYRARAGAGGNEQDWYRSRMTIVEKDLWRTGPAMLKGQRQASKLVFDVLHPSVQQVRLELHEVVTGYEANGLPRDRVDLVFPFTVHVSLAQGPYAGSRQELADAADGRTGTGGPRGQPQGAPAAACGPGPSSRAMASTSSSHSLRAVPPRPRSASTGSPRTSMPQ